MPISRFHLAAFIANLRCLSIFIIKSINDKKIILIKYVIYYSILIIIIIIIIFIIIITSIYIAQQAPCAMSAWSWIGAQCRSRSVSWRPVWSNEFLILTWTIVRMKRCECPAADCSRPALPSVEKLVRQSWSFNCGWFKLPLDIANVYCGIFASCIIFEIVAKEAILPSLNAAWYFLS